jgi:hypothetical protein
MLDPKTAQWKRLQDLGLWRESTAVDDQVLVTARHERGQALDES